jgi:hypothetical protein
MSCHFFRRPPKNVLSVARLAQPGTRHVFLRDWHSGAQYSILARFDDVIGDCWALPERERRQNERDVSVAITI